MNAATGWRAPLQLVAVLAVEAAAVIALHRLGALPFLQVGWADPAAWLAGTAPEDVLLAVCRLAALGCAYWLLAGTALYTLAAATRVPSAVRAVEWAALPAVRRVADRAVAVTLATSSVVGAGGTAWADAPDVPPPPPPVVATEAPSAPPDDLYRPLPAGPSEPPSTGGVQADIGAVTGVYFPAPAAEAAMPTPVLATAPISWPPPPPAPAPAEHVVVRGDDLWSIAEQRLAAARLASGRIDDVPREEVVVYWRQLVEANLDRLRSGDADLLQPGEVLQLPPLPG